MASSGLPKSPSIPDLPELTPDPARQAALKQGRHENYVVFIAGSKVAEDKPSQHNKDVMQYFYTKEFKPELSKLNGVICGVVLLSGADSFYYHNYRRHFAASKWDKIDPMILGGFCHHITNPLLFEPTYRLPIGPLFEEAKQEAKEEAKQETNQGPPRQRRTQRRNQNNNKNNNKNNKNKKSRQNRLGALKISPQNEYYDNMFANPKLVEWLHNNISVCTAEKNDAVSIHCYRPEHNIHHYKLVVIKEPWVTMIFDKIKIKENRYNPLFKWYPHISQPPRYKDRYQQEMIRDTSKKWRSTQMPKIPEEYKSDYGVAPFNEGTYLYISYIYSQFFTCFCLIHICTFLICFLKFALLYTDDIELCSPHLELKRAAIAKVLGHLCVITADAKHRQLVSRRYSQLVLKLRLWNGNEVFVDAFKNIHGMLCS